MSTTDVPTPRDPAPSDFAQVHAQDSKAQLTECGLSPSSERIDRLFTDREHFHEVWLKIDSSCGLCDAAIRRAAATRQSAENERLAARAETLSKRALEDPAWLALFAATTLMEWELDGADDIARAGKELLYNARDRLTNGKSRLCDAAFFEVLEPIAARVTADIRNRMRNELGQKLRVDFEKASHELASVSKDTAYQNAFKDGFVRATVVALNDTSSMMLAEPIVPLKAE